MNVSRGTLEFRADPESQYHNPAFGQDKTVLVYCASSGRSALAGKTLKDMGYGSVFNSAGSRNSPMRASRPRLRDSGKPRRLHPACMCRRSRNA